MNLRRLSLAVAFVLSPAALAGDTLVPAGTVWKYLDNGTDKGAVWRDPGFDDAAWAAGPAQLGYGDGDEQTVVSYGGSSSNKYITTYFRHAFTVDDPSAFLGLRLGVVRDDGVVVYINGVEAARSNMPAGDVNYLTRASGAIGGADESVFQPFELPASMLVAGENVLAVEIHQANPTSSDISFDLELIGDDGTPQLTRGPYIQMTTPGSTVIRWRTDRPGDSVVRYGDAPDSLGMVASLPDQVTEHEVSLASLTSGTNYYYQIESGGAVLAGGDADHRFVTNPTPGTRQPTRVWVIGDSGTANNNARAVRDAFTQYSAGDPADLWVMLGDNAYNSGTDAEFQAAVFDTYPDLLRNTTLWPTLGNHDGISADSDSETGPYYDSFTLPRAGEAGGLPSGTEAYYSFDYANIHFICLESFETDRSAGGPMMTWLQADLDAAEQEWIIAFWHHPPYSKGSHDSDEESHLIEMRENALPILESYGVDLVLCGHSHGYERSHLLDGHYGASDTFSPSMLLDDGDGRPDGDGPYTKGAFGQEPHDGAVYVVAGSSGSVDPSGRMNHPVMYLSLRKMGSLVIDVDHNVLEARLLDWHGQPLDHFTLVKGGDLVPAMPRSLEARVVPGSHVDLSWLDAANNESQYVVERSPNGSSWIQLASLSANSERFTDLTATDPDGYQYRVQARNSQGRSSWSNVVTVGAVDGGCAAAWSEGALASDSEPRQARRGSLGTLLLLSAGLMFRRRRR